MFSSLQKFKLQFWSLDIIFAIVIFGIVLTILLFIWLNVNSNLSASYSNTNIILQTQNHQLSQDLLTPGIPNNWPNSVNTTNISTWNGITIGLSSSQRSINFSLQKLYTFIAMVNYNYSYTKQILGLSYNYYILITGPSFNLSIGENPQTHGATIVNIETSSIFINTQTAVMKTIVWSN